MNTNKYGFWLVLYHSKSGENSVCRDLDDYTQIYYFNSEHDAEQFKNEVAELMPHNYYYLKFIPWGEYA